jgi:hypothetical protein
MCELKLIQFDVYSMAEIEASPTDSVESRRNGLQPGFDLQTDKPLLSSSLTKLNSTGFTG